MTTALFPADGRPITISQGKTGDCYFLASLDCIFNSGPEGLAKIKSLFTETEHGVTVRIKRTAISAHLKADKVKIKYDYFYDRVRDEDVFIISKERLNIIDTPSIGVKTNSLAVKILEHLSSYYYVEDWDHGADIMASVIAHNVSNRHQGTSTEFVGRLLGVDTEDLNDIDKIIKLKTLAPEYPVYISMSYGVKDIYGNTHGRHGLRLDKIIRNPLMAGGYEFVLVNPWDNQKTESYSLDDIKSRKYRFCLFKPDSPKVRLTRLLLDLPLEEGQNILSTASLLSLMLDLQSLKPSFSSEDIKRCSALYKNMPKLGELFNFLLPEEKIPFLQAVYRTNGNKDIFLNSMLSSVSRLELVKFILANEKLGDTSTPLAVDYCLRGKDQELFTLLNSVDFLTQIDSSTLDKTVFLNSLIELHFAQATVNLDQLLVISKYISRYNLIHVASPLTVVLTEKTIFQEILAKAISEKAIQLGGDREAAKKYVENGLVQYYFNNANDHITRSGGLRTLFMNPQFPKTLLEDIDSPEWIISATVQFLKSFPVSSGLREKIRSQAHHLRPIQLNTILDNMIVDTPRSLFASLYELSQLNSEFASILHHQVIEQFTKKFAIPFSSFVEQLRREESSDFTRWFFKAIPTDGKDALQEQARFVISDYLAKIQNFPVSFQAHHSVGLIDRAVLDFEFALKKLARESTLIAAQNQLGEQEAAESIKAINAEVMQKIKIVKLAAEVQVSVLRSAETTIAEYVRLIKLFSYSYAISYTASEVEQEKASRHRNLNAIVQQYKVVDALKILGFTQPHYPSNLAEVLKEKEAEITSAALKRQFELSQADAVITKMIDSISLLSASFGELASISLVTEHSSVQLEKLYGLMQDKEMLKAQQMLGLRDQTHPKLVRAIESKAQIIIEAAEQRIDKIKLVHQTVLEDCARQIQEQSISFTSLYSVQKIEAHERLLLAQLDPLVNNTKIKAALMSLGFNQLPEGIKKVLTEKQKAIRSEALKQKTLLLREAETSIDFYLEKINSFAVSFPNVDMEWAINQRCSELITNLRAIINEPRIEEALILNPSARQRIERAFLVKEEAIRSAAERLQVPSSKLKDAQIVLEDCVRAINEFSVSFESLDLISQINTNQNLALAQLDQLLNDSKVQAALELLHFKELPQTLKEVLAKKQEAIVAAATKQNNILFKAAQSTIVSYLELIRAFEVTFPNVHSVQRIDKRQADLSSNLHAIANELLLKEALILVPSAQQAIQELVLTKEEGIRSAAEKLQIQAKTLDAQATLQRCLESIHNLFISFADLASISEVEKQQKLLLTQLERLLNHTTVKDALVVLTQDDELLQVLKKTFAEKQSTIHEAAIKQKGIILHEGNITLESYLQRIRDFEVSFPKVHSEQLIAKRSADLSTNLHDILQESQSAAVLVLVPSAHEELQEAVLAKDETIRSTAAKAQQALAHAKAKVILEQSGFLAHLTILLDKTIELEKKKGKSDGYRLAASKARILYEAIDQAKKDFLTKPVDLEEKLKTFKDTSNDAIREALPVLKEHREWKQAALDIINILLTLCSGFTSYLATKRFRLFTVPTDSEEKVLDLKQNIQQITAGGG